MSISIFNLIKTGNLFICTIINRRNINKFLLIIWFSIILYFKTEKKIISQSKLIYLSEIEKKLNISLDFIKIYSNLFYASQKGLTKRTINSISNKEPIHIKDKKGVGICSIGRKENLYAKEFVEYYIKLGIKKIIIYDDNEINEEKFEDVLKEYIINGKVKIIDIHGFESAQLPSYNDCYKKYGNEFDFILFLDFDEFVQIENNKDINTYLYNHRFEKCETIVLNWVVYGDNDLVKYDNRTLVERFKKPYGNKKKGKCIVRTNISKLIITYSHKIGINIKYFCDSNGNRIFQRYLDKFNPPNKPEAFIKHFYTKSAEEFCIKINKGDAHFHKSHPKVLYAFKKRIKGFFIYNKITDEKIKIIQNCSGMNLSMYKNFKKNRKIY